MRIFQNGAIHVRSNERIIDDRMCPCGRAPKMGGKSVCHLCFKEQYGLI